MVFASLAIFFSLLATHLQSQQLHLALMGGSSHLTGTDFSQMRHLEMRRESKHCCFAGNRTGSPLLIMGCTLGLSRKQTRLHFQLWIFGSLRLLESSISFRFWLLHLFTWTIKTFLFRSSRAVYRSAHVVCIAHTKIFWGCSSPVLVLWSVLRDSGKSPQKSVAQNVLPLFWLTGSLSWGKGCLLVQIWSRSVGLRAGVAM